MNPEEVLNFWFCELSPKDWWVKNPDLDEQIRSRFGSLHSQAASMELWPWRDDPDGRLAEIIVLDQFSRNMFRGDPRSFAQDPAALALAQEGVRLGVDQEIAAGRRAFFYMPYMHSESKAVHVESMALFTRLAEVSPGNLEAAKSHAKIVREFGRYPHRNAVLGRQSTPEEEAFLQQPGSSF